MSILGQSPMITNVQTFKPPQMISGRFFRQKGLGLSAGLPPPLQKQNHLNLGSKLNCGFSVSPQLPYQQQQTCAFLITVVASMQGVGPSLDGEASSSSGKKHRLSDRVNSYILTIKYCPSFRKASNGSSLVKLPWTPAVSVHSMIPAILDLDAKNGKPLKVQGLTTQGGPKDHVLPSEDLAARLEKVWYTLSYKFTNSRIWKIQYRLHGRHRKSTDDVYYENIIKVASDYVLEDGKMCLRKIMEEKDYFPGESYSCMKFVKDMSAALNCPIVIKFQTVNGIKVLDEFRFLYDLSMQPVPHPRFKEVVKSVGDDEFYLEDISDRRGFTSSFKGLYAMIRRTINDMSRQIKYLEEMPKKSLQLDSVEDKSIEESISALKRGKKVVGKVHDVFVENGLQVCFPYEKAAHLPERTTAAVLDNMIIVRRTLLGIVNTRF